MSKNLDTKILSRKHLGLRLRGAVCPLRKIVAGRLEWAQVKNGGADGCGCQDGKGVTAAGGEVGAEGAEQTHRGGTEIGHGWARMPTDRKPGGR